MTLSLCCHQWNGPSETATEAQRHGEHEEESLDLFTSVSVPLRLRGLLIPLARF